MHNKSLPLQYLAPIAPIAIITNPLATTAKGRTLAIHSKNQIFRIQTHAEFHAFCSRGILHFQDHKASKDENRNLFENQFKDCLNHNKIVIRPFNNKREQRRTLDKGRKSTEQAQIDNRQLVKLAKQQSSTISNQANPQHQSPCGHKQSGEVTKAEKQSRDKGRVLKSIYVKDGYLSFTPPRSRKNQHSAQDYQKKVKQLALKVKDIVVVNYTNRQPQNNHQESSFLDDSEHKSITFRDVYKHSKRQNLSRRRRLSLGNKHKQISFEATSNILKPIQIKSLQLNTRNQGENAQSQRNSKEAINISKDMWSKIRQRNDLSDNDFRGENRGQRVAREDSGRQGNMRLGLYTSYLSRKINQQQNELKGWQDDTFNSLPQFL